MSLIMPEVRSASCTLRPCNGRPSRGHVAPGPNGRGLAPLLAKNLHGDDAIALEASCSSCREVVAAIKLSPLGPPSHDAVVGAWT